MPDFSDFNDLEKYRSLFTDVNFWTPFVRQVCQRHRLSVGSIRVGIPGTYPAFIVSERWLVKFFGRLFEGEHAFYVEQAGGRLAALDPAIPIARILASGELGPEDWPWPYLIYEFIPGVSIGEAWGNLSGEGRRAVAKELGELVRRLHALPIESSAMFPNDRTGYQRFLQEQRAVCVQNQRAWGTLQPHLIDQIDAFMPPLETLIDQSRPAHLIHADLTRDHLLGTVESGRWQTLALIDFGDAMTGDLLYELVALHLDLFRGDTRLLGDFLGTYGFMPDQRAALPRPTLATCLLHRFNVLSVLPVERLQVSTLEELAESLWATLI